MHLKIDGLDTLRAEIGVREIASLIERTARWVDPATFRLLPVWYPEHARRRHFYKANWSEPLTNTNRATKATVHKLEGNTKANQALTLALGLRAATRPNWTCCHLWGVDDEKFQKSNDVVSDHRYYSCVANMVLLPTPMKAFTDAIPEIKAMMRICARNLYGWQCDHESMKAVNEALGQWQDWDAYPSSWPRSSGEKLPMGLVKLTPEIEQQALKRRAAIFSDLEHAGPFYPREAVRSALKYWGISQ